LFVQCADGGQDGLAECARGLSGDGSGSEGILQGPFFEELLNDPERVFVVWVWDEVVHPCGVWGLDLVECGDGVEDGFLVLSVDALEEDKLDGSVEHSVRTDPPDAVPHLVDLVAAKLLPCSIHDHLRISDTGHYASRGLPSTCLKYRS
jgi:hypothetical protein